MNRIVLFVMMLSVFFSCEKDEDELVGIWKLVKMVGSWSGSETGGAEMEWQENYLLNEEGTFLKTRIRDGIVTKETGKYVINEDSNQEYMELTFDSENDIVASCYGGLKEIMIKSDNVFLGTWNACDGPSLTYEKLN